MFGALRNKDKLCYFPDKYHSQLLNNIDILDQENLISSIKQVRPEIIINCSGLVKQLEDANDPLLILPVNAMLPHRLDKICSLTGIRLIQFSTDCVFSGKKGMYRETDKSDADDLYGKSKYIGEVHESTSTTTLRTSVIGHELDSVNGLSDWFLSQTGAVKGYKKAIFSGIPSFELARIIEKYVVTNSKIRGLYHVSAEPINKLSLLKLVAKEYGKNIEIIPDEKVSIDRSLDSSLFRKVTGYSPPSWPDLIKIMHNYK